MAYPGGRSGETTTQPPVPGIAESGTTRSRSGTPRPKLVARGSARGGNGRGAAAAPGSDEAPSAATGATAGAACAVGRPKAARVPATPAPFCSMAASSIAAVSPPAADSANPAPAAPDAGPDAAPGADPEA